MAEPNVEKDILGDGSDDDPYYIDGTKDLHFEVISMDFNTMKAIVRID